MVLHKQWQWEHQVQNLRQAVLEHVIFGCWPASLPPSGTFPISTEGGLGHALQLAAKWPHANKSPIQPFCSQYTPLLGPNGFSLILIARNGNCFVCNNLQEHAVLPNVFISMKKGQSHFTRRVDPIVVEAINNGGKLGVRPSNWNAGLHNSNRRLPALIRIGFHTFLIYWTGWGCWDVDI